MSQPWVNHGSPMGHTCVKWVMYGSTMGHASPIYGSWVTPHFAESHFAESHFAEPHFAESNFAESNLADSYDSNSNPCLTLMIGSRWVPKTLMIAGSIVT